MVLKTASKAAERSRRIRMVMWPLSAAVGVGDQLKSNEISSMFDPDGPDSDGIASAMERI